MKFVKVTAFFKAPDIDFAEELICSIFFSYNLKGVVCDVPLDEPDEGFGTRTLPEPEKMSITGFFPAIDSSSAIIDGIKEKMRAVSEHDIHVDIETTIVDEKEWADAWKDFFEVTPITDKIIVKPDWKPYTPNPGEILIHLDPGMAFGTGTHPTTAMCIQLIEAYLQPGDTFLDVGTGSGILMIAARKLGASQMTGIDTDEVAIDVTQTNLEKNKISIADCRLTCTTLDQTPKTQYRFIAANIIAQVIVEIAGQIGERLDNDGTAVLSGIISERLPDVLTSLEAHSLQVIEKKTDQEWVALAVKKKSIH